MIERVQEPAVEQDVPVAAARRTVLDHEPFPLVELPATAQVMDAWLAVDGATGPLGPGPQRVRPNQIGLRGHREHAHQPLERRRHPPEPVREAPRLDHRRGRCVVERFDRAPSRARIAHVAVEVTNPDVDRTRARTAPHDAVVAGGTEAERVAVEALDRVHPATLDAVRGERAVRGLARVPSPAVNPPQNVQNLPHRNLPVRHPAPLSRGRSVDDPGSRVGSRSRENHDPRGIMPREKTALGWEQGRGR